LLLTPKYNGHICVGLNISVIPKKSIDYIDITFKINKNMTKYATFFGGAIDDKESQEYKYSIEIGRILAMNGYTVKNGGYRGLMEAVSKGASQEFGEVIGYTCKTFPSTEGNEYLTKTVICEDLYERLRELISGSDIYIAQAGGIGTLSEITLALDILRKEKGDVKVFLIGDTWKTIFGNTKKIMRKRDFERLVLCSGFEEFTDNFLHIS
jgi:hypothetical protein